MINVFVYPDHPYYFFLLTLAYNLSHYDDKPRFWDSLQCLATAHSKSWLIFGDFNSVALQSEKRGGCPFASSLIGGLRHFITSCGLVDLNFHGNPFTWNNRRGGCTNIRERLDRCLANQKWQVQYPNASVLHSPAVASDHLSLILNTEGHGQFLPCPFKFKAIDS